MPTAALPLLLLALPSLLESKPCRSHLLGSPLDTLVINWETLTGSEAQSRRWSRTLSPFSPRSHAPGGGDGPQGCRQGDLWRAVHGKAASSGRGSMDGAGQMGKAPHPTLLPEIPYPLL